MSWMLYRGDGQPGTYTVPPSPPWRTFPMADINDAGRSTFQSVPELVEAVNAALYLRRPLLITGSPGSGKSSVAESVAHELGLGRVLRWNVTSRSTLEDAMYRYDALGRLQQTQEAKNRDERSIASPDIAQFLRLGPLGTALVAENQPRVLLIDELDKGELDLPSDLLNVLERGEYEIPELNRYEFESVPIREADSDDTHIIVKGRIRCQHFPVIVMTSNGERDFPGPFLRRCIRINLAMPDKLGLVRIVEAHLDGSTLDDDTQALIGKFAERLGASGGRRPTLAIDQLLNTIFLVTQAGLPEGTERQRLIDLLQRELDRT